MTHHGRDVDYNEEKARIDNSGFDPIHAIAGDICDNCGKIIEEDEPYTEAHGLKYCEVCSGTVDVVDLTKMTKSILGIK